MHWIYITFALTLQMVINAYDYWTNEISPWLLAFTADTSAVDLLSYIPICSQMKTTTSNVSKLRLHNHFASTVPWQADGLTANCKPLVPLRATDRHTSSREEARFCAQLAAYPCLWHRHQNTGLTMHAGTQVAAHGHTQGMHQRDYIVALYPS